VDNQQSESSMMFAMEDTGDFINPNSLDGVKEENQGLFESILGMDSTRMVTIALIPGVAGIVILIGFLIIRRKMASATTVPVTIGSADAEKAASHAIITGGGLVRDSSMEEIDLASDTDANATNLAADKSKENVLRKSSNGTQSPTIYELNRVTSSSSESSGFSSPYSSANTTPSLRTPESMRRTRASSPTLDMSDFLSAAHNSRRARREKASSMIAEPTSRLGKRSMDSPYFAKENPFDSPMRSPFDSPACRTPSSSQELAAPPGSADFAGLGHAGNGHPLQSSQEINQLHRNPFDSPSVLHSAIQRAAMLRGQQQQEQSQRKPPKIPSPASGLRRKKGKPLSGRRASLGGAQVHNAGRRSSLGAISLHASALRASMGEYETSTDDDINDSDNDYAAEQQQRPTSLRSAQYIQRIDEASDE